MLGMTYVIICSFIQKGEHDPHSLLWKTLSLDHVDFCSKLCITELAFNTNGEPLIVISKGDTKEYSYRLIFNHRST